MRLSLRARQTAAVTLLIALAYFVNQALGMDIGPDQMLFREPAGAASGPSPVDCF